RHRALPSFPTRRSSDLRAGHEAADVRTLSLASGSGLAVSGAMYRRDDRIEFDAQITDEVRGRILHSLEPVLGRAQEPRPALTALDRKSTRLNSSHQIIS